MAYRLVNTASIESLHGPLCSTGVVKLYKTIVVSFAVVFLDFTKKKILINWRFTWFPYKRLREGELTFLSGMILMLMT